MKHAIYQPLFDQIARLTEGRALIAADNGRILLSGGQEMSVLPALHSACLSEVLAGKKTMAVRVQDGLAVAIFRLAENQWLLLDNCEKITSAQKQKQAIIDSLPFIAQIAGGDATLFNAEGIRENAFFPDGSQNIAAIGEYKELYKRTLEEMRPSIGPAFFAKNASAVRIPITNEYGLAFNNKQSSQRQQRLLENQRGKYAYYHFDDITGISDAIYQAKKIAQTAARTNSTVLLEGETGTGKEIFAQAIHNASNRATSPFVAVNCGAIPENLVESSLFGYSEGAFTGAKKTGSTGAFEQADKGTLFLDEISEMPLDMQVRLLRAIQEREITKVGESQPIKIDVRIIAATNLQLKELVDAGRFRADLYFRLNVLTVQVPSLRERMDDLTHLLDSFLHKFANLMKKTDAYLELAPPLLEALKQYSWPGNVRELQNCAEYIMNILEPGDDAIGLKHLPHYIIDSVGSQSVSHSRFEEYMDKRENEFLLKAFKDNAGNKSQMAKQIGVNRTTLLRLLKKHGIK